MDHPPHWGGHGVSCGLEDMISTIPPNILGASLCTLQKVSLKEKCVSKLNNWLFFFFLFSFSQGLHFFYKVSMSLGWSAFAVIWLFAPKTAEQNPHPLTLTPVPVSLPVAFLCKLLSPGLSVTAVSSEGISAHRGTDFLPAAHKQ